MLRLAAAFVGCWAMLAAAASIASPPRSPPTAAILPPAKDAAGVTPRNLKVLPADIPEADLVQLMVRYSQELGVQCQFCHAESSQGIDFVSDQSPAKQTARVMIGMLRDINTKYLAQVSDRRYSVPLTCGNCHQGQTTPPVYEARP
jgi:hypothetical protein